jgi:hypothetical protein
MPLPEHSLQRLLASLFSSNTVSVDGIGLV